MLRNFVLCCALVSCNKATPLASPSGGAHLDVQRPVGVSIVGTDVVSDPLTAGLPTSLLYTIANTGAATLTVTSVNADTAVNCLLAVTPPTVTSLAAAASTTFSLSVNAIAAGAWSAKITVASNDATHPSFAFVVSGTAATSLSLSDKALTSFSIANPSAMGVINEAAKTVSVTVPFGTDVTGLVATFTSSGASVSIGSTTQVSGVTANDFTSPVSYVVTAADNSTAAYVATVNVASISSKTLASFSFTSPAEIGTINESAKTVAVTVPFGTTVTALVASFTTTGASVKVGGTVQVSGTTANDFTNPVSYLVTAADSSTATYVVTVTVSSAAAKALTSFSFVSPSVSGIIDQANKKVSIAVPNGTKVTALIASFTTSGASVNIGGVVQQPGTTPNNFSSTLDYTVVAADNSTAIYAVNVTVLPPGGPLLAIEQPVGISISYSGQDVVTSPLAVGVQTPVVVTVANHGVADLGNTTPLNVTIEAGAVNCSVVVTQPSSTTLAPGASTTFSLGVTATAAGPWLFVAHVASDDPVHPDFAFTVTGSTPSATAPQLTLVQDSSGATIPFIGVANYGTLLTVGPNAGVTFTVENTGGANLVLTSATPLGAGIGVPSNCSAVITQPTTLTVVPGSSTTFSLTVTVTAAGAWNEYFLLRSNDPLFPYFAFAVSGDTRPPGTLQVQQPVETVVDNLGTDALAGQLGVGPNRPIGFALFNVVGAGTGSLFLTDPTPVTVDSSVNCTVSINQPQDLAIAPGETLPFSLGITVGMVGPYSFNVHVASDDPATPDYLFSVNGTAAAPEPQISVYVPNHAVTNAATITTNRVAPDRLLNIPVVVQNKGAANLSITSVTLGGALHFRDAALSTASIAPGDALSFVLKLDTATSGGGTVAIASNDPSNGSFSFTLQYNILTSSLVLFTYPGTGAELLLASDTTGSAPVTISATTSGGGVGSFIHRDTYTVFQEAGVAPASTAPDLFYSPLPASNPPVNLTRTQTNNGVLPGWAFCGDTLVFIASTSATQRQLYAIDMSSGALGPSGPTSSTLQLNAATPPIGATGVQSLAVSPFGDKIAYIGDMDTKGVNEVYVADVATANSSVKLSPPLTSQQSIGPMKWASDNHHLIYTRSTTTSAVPANMDYFWVDLDTMVAEKINATQTGAIRANFSISQTSTAVYFTAGGDGFGAATEQLFGVSTIQGPQLPPVNLSSLALSASFGPAGVGAFALDSRGNNVLFTADSGSTAGHPGQLYLAKKGSPPPTTPVVASAATSTKGVVLTTSSTFVSDSQVLYRVDDAVGGRMNLYASDLTFASPVAVPVTQTGSNGVTSYEVSGDAQSLVCISDQGQTEPVMFSSALSSPASNQIGGIGLFASAILPLVDQTIFFVQDSAAAARPQSLWAGSIGTPGATLMSGTTVAGPTGTVGQFEGYSHTRAFFVADNSNNSALYVDDLGNAPVQLSTGACAGSCMIFATGEE